MMKNYSININYKRSTSPHCRRIDHARTAAAGQAMNAAQGLTENESINYAYDPSVLAQLQSFYNHDNSVLTGHVGVCPSNTCWV